MALDFLGPFIPYTPRVYTVSLGPWRFPSPVRIVQTTFYFPLQHIESQNGFFLMDFFQKLMIPIWYEPLQRRCLLGGIVHGKVQGEVEYQGQQCQALVVFVEWRDDGPLDITARRRAGDAEILKKKSPASHFHLEKFSISGFEERYCMLFAPLEMVAPPRQLVYVR